MAFAITELKKGTIFELDSVPYKVIEYSQKVMGRGGSIVNVRIKSLIDGKVLDKTFKGSEQLDYADVVKKEASYLYADNENYYFMDNETFEQFNVLSSIVDDIKYFLKEGDKVQIQLFNNKPINIEIPNSLPLKVEYTEEIVRGDTSTNLLKDAQLETGLVIKVPPFIKQGDLIRVDTRTSEYIEREK
ncbi:MAG TPA: elongation factor P [Candidatus Saccharimonadia bacterium]|nr:elongation factor P [Candidatus Saccharimonadia bacterium]